MKPTSGHKCDFCDEFAITLLYGTAFCEGHSEEYHKLGERWGDRYTPSPLTTMIKRYSKSRKNEAK